jgi:hypothetical protein
MVSSSLQRPQFHTTRNHPTILVAPPTSSPSMSLLPLPPPLTPESPAVSAAPAVTEKCVTQVLYEEHNQLLKMIFIQCLGLKEDDNDNSSSLCWKSS